MWMFSRIKESHRSILVVLAAYVVFWIVIFPMISDCVIFGTDCSGNAGRSLAPLFGFLETGRVGMLSDGSTYTYNPLGYSTVLWLLGVQPEMLHPFATVIPIQAALLFAIGLMVFAVVKEVWGRFAVTALVIAVFNPNALFVAAQPREDSFFAFFIAVAITSILRHRFGLVCKFSAHRTLFNLCTSGPVAGVCPGDGPSRCRTRVFEKRCGGCVTGVDSNPALDVSFI
jgi:hypothetical protein